MATNKFKYVGDPNDNFGGPEVVHQYGKVWKKGEVVTVEEDKEDPTSAENLFRLRGNSHFVDLSDKETVSDVAERQKVLEKKAKDEAKAAEDQRKKDEADRKEMERNYVKQSKNQPRVTAATAPTPPGTVTREPATDPFGGRTVEERTAAEDHTKAGKTKGGTVTTV